MNSFLLRDFIMPDELPSGDKAVYVFIEMIALGFVLYAIEEAFKDQPSWKKVVIALVLGILFFTVGIKWPTVKSKIQAASLRQIEQVAGTRSYRWGIRAVLTALAVSIALNLGFRLRDYYHAHFAIAPLAPPVKRLSLPPPKVTYPIPLPKPKPVLSSIQWADIVRGVAEPKGAPFGDDNSKTNNEINRLNKMSLTQLRDLVADVISRLNAHHDEWLYGASQSLDSPPIGPDGRESPEDMKIWNQELATKNKNEQEVRPTKRALDFKNKFETRFPRVSVLVTYLTNKYSKGSPPNECFPGNKMNEFESKVCADYLQGLLDKDIPTPQ